MNIKAVLNFQEKEESSPYVRKYREKGKFYSIQKNEIKRIHSVDKPFQCQICDKTFTRLYHLRVHQRIHSGNKPFECKICNKKFVSSSDLRTHERTHYQDKPYEC